MTKKAKRRPSLRRALITRLLVFSLGVMLTAMWLITITVAQDMQTQVHDDLNQYVQGVSNRENHDDSGLPGQVEVNMIEALGHPYYWINIRNTLPFTESQHLTNGISSDDWLWGKWSLYYGYEAAVIYYNEAGDILAQTGDWLTFTYTTEENWVNGSSEALGHGYVYLNEVPGGEKAFDGLLLDSPYGSMSTSIIMPLLRLTGYFEGSRFHPVSIERGRYLYEGGWGWDIDTWRQMDARKNIQWESIFTLDGESPEPLQTIYAWDADGLNWSHTPVSYEGETYRSLVELLDVWTQMKAVPPEEFPGNKESLWDTVLFSASTHTDAYGTYQIAVAVRCNPIFYALLRMKGLWFGALMLSVYMVRWLCLGKVSGELMVPLKNLAYAARHNTYLTPCSDWQEVREAEEYYVRTQKTLSENLAELHRLRTALEYANDAEERRKRLISDITHELKTPLAIIHSYTECLQEDVAPEKRAQYLATIQEETERMDALVAQMLELSRLDAGKVRLRSEPVELTELTKAVAEPFTPMLEGKGLTLRYPVAMDFTVLADEGRMRQVITNLLSNAVKYTPEGGEILARIFVSGKTAYLVISNTAPALSEEALDRVFDSFYRGDASRNTAGTGLGLALVKSIVNLHGGTVSVRNVPDEAGKNWVEFRVELPLGE